MSALEHTDGTTVLGSVVVDYVLKPDGQLGISYGMEGLTREAAIGFLVATTDRLREEARFSWDTDPSTGEPWEGADDEDGEDE